MFSCRLLAFLSDNTATLVNRWQLFALSVCVCVCVPASVSVSVSVCAHACMHIFTVSFST